MASNIARGLWFEITNDSGTGTTDDTLYPGKINQSVITEPSSAQITNDTGEGSGVMAGGSIDSVTRLIQAVP